MGEHTSEIETALQRFRAANKALADARAEVGRAQGELGEAIAAEMGFHVGNLVQNQYGKLFKIARFKGWLNGISTDVVGTKVLKNGGLSADGPRLINHITIPGDGRRPNSITVIKGADDA